MKKIVNECSEFSTIFHSICRNKQMDQIQDNEIDLFEFFGTLWDGKWKILAITVVAAVVGVSLYAVKPNLFEVSTPIQTGNQSVFLKYTALNEVLKDERIGYDKETNANAYIVDGASIFKMFVREFNDYEEMVDAVRTSDFVQKSIKDLNEVDKQKALIGFAKAFKLKAPTKIEKNSVLSFEWHDTSEGKRLLYDAIQKTLSNIKNISIANVNELAESIEFRNTQRLEKLRNQLIFISQNQISADRRRVQYLIEQSAIAKELEIETNRLDANALSQTSQNAISLSVSSNDVPYYLRGYKAIDKEILLIRNRSDEDRLLTAEGYLETQKKIFSLEKDLSPSQIRGASETIATDNPKHWVKIDLSLADVKPRKKLMPYVALSIILGGIFGAIYLLISNAIRKRKEHSAQAQ